MPPDQVTRRRWRPSGGPSAATVQVLSSSGHHRDIEQDRSGTGGRLTRWRTISGGRRRSSRRAQAVGYLNLLADDRNACLNARRHQCCVARPRPPSGADYRRPPRWAHDSKTTNTTPLWLRQQMGGPWVFLVMPRMTPIAAHARHSADGEDVLRVPPSLEIISYYSHIFPRRLAGTM